MARLAKISRHPIRALGRTLRQRVQEFVHTRRSYRFPAEGIAFVFITLTIGLAAMNTAAQLLFLVFAMMCSFWMLSAVLATASRGKVTVSRIAPRIAGARRSVRIQIRLSNRKRFLTSFSLRVSDQLEGHIPVGAAFFARVPARTRQIEDYECVFPQRGLYRFESLTLATRFPFGLIERVVTHSEPHEMLVLPAEIRVDGFIRAARVDLGDYESHLKGRGTGLYGIRELAPGDSARDIHWKVSARQGRLMVREYESEEKRKASILLDNRLPLNARGEDLEEFERAIIVTSSLLGYLIERGHQVELLTATGKVAFGQGPQHLLRCRRALALLKPEPLEAKPPHAHVPEADSVQFSVLYRVGQEAAGDAYEIRTADFKAELDAVEAVELEHARGKDLTIESA